MEIPDKRWRGTIIELYHELEIAALYIFTVYCFWHGHKTTAWIFLGLSLLDDWGTSARRNGQ